MSIWGQQGQDHGVDVGLQAATSCPCRQIVRELCHTSVGPDIPAGLQARRGGGGRGWEPRALQTPPARGAATGAARTADAASSRRRHGRRAAPRPPPLQMGGLTLNNALALLTSL